MAISEEEFLALTPGDIVHLINAEDARYNDDSLFEEIRRFFGTDVEIHETEDHGEDKSSDFRFSFSIVCHKECCFILHDIDYIVRDDDRPFVNDVDLNMLF